MKNCSRTKKVPVPKASKNYTPMSSNTPRKTNKNPTRKMRGCGAATRGCNTRGPMA